MSTEKLAQLSPEKRALLLKLLKSKSDAAGGLRRQSRDAEYFPVSFGQHRIWFLEQMLPGNPFFNECYGTRFQVPMNVVALEGAVNEIVRRHEALRTTFAVVNGDPVQVIKPELHVPLSVIDLTHLPAAECEREAQRLAGEEAQQPIDISKGPLIHTTLLRLGANDYIFLVNIHHIVYDGWSTHVFAHELETLYTAYVSGQKSPLPELSIQYADFAIWQRQSLQGGGLTKQLTYWRKQLADLPTLRLPLDRPRPPVQSYRGAHQHSEIKSEVYIPLRDLSQREGVTMFMVMMAAFKVLLHRYSGQDEIVLGVPIANRSRPELEKLIGFFVNILVMRTDLSGDPTFREVLQRVRKVSLEAYEHQDIPFEKLVDEVQPERETGRSPLFQVAFQVFNVPPTAGKTAEGGELQIETGITKF
ncbi:MAG TPA: condensation domain-containing protein, partial [Pyrinomonadaceae bacterium]